VEGYLLRGLIHPPQRAREGDLKSPGAGERTTDRETYERNRIIKGGIYPSISFKRRDNYG
jgi:hypothetical protein